jgi:cupin fold WbuC family metalloprotein
MREISPEVVVADDPITLLWTADLTKIVARARAAPRQRARILLHGSSDEVMQEMMIVMTRGQYVPPIWNDRSPKSYLVLSGCLKLVRFHISGAVTDCYRLAANDPTDPFFARINERCWHMSISDSPEVVFLETILGPHRGTMFADWAPAPSSSGATGFFTEVCKQCGVPIDPA